MDIAHNVSLATISSIWLVLVGFLFISYEFLGRPAGFLRWLMRVIVSSLIIPVPCLLLAFFTPASYSLWSFNLREIVIRFAVYGGLVGGFYGLFTHSSDVRKQQPQQQQLFDIRSLSKGMPWRKKVGSFLSDRPDIWICIDSFIGFVFASLYWCFITYVVLFISYYNSPTDLWLGYVRVAGMGIIGGAYWRLLHQPSISTATNKPPTFSLPDCLRGTMYWFGVCFVLYLLSALLLAIIWHKPIEVSKALLLGTMGLIIIGGLLSGCAQFFMRTVAASSSRNRLKTLLLWSPMWAGFWVVAVMIFQTEMAIIPKQIHLPTSFSLIQAYFLFGTIITILTGVIMMLIIKFNMRLAYIYHLISLKMFHFSIVSRRRSSFLNSTRKHFRWIIESSDGKPPLFSVRDSLIGLVFWPATWLAGNVIGWLLVTSRFSHSGLHSLLDISLGLPQSDMIAEIQPDVIARIVAIPIAGLVAGGLSRFICWKILNIRGERQLGTFGAIITIVGFMFQLVEPIQHLLVVHLDHGHHGPVFAVAWSANGRQIASASSDSSDTTIQVWNSSTGKTDVVYHLYTSPVTAVAWSPNKKYIASSSSTRLDIWDAANGHDVHTLNTNTTPITSMAWSPDGRYLAYATKSTSTSGKVLVWGFRNPDTPAELTPKSHAGSVKKVVWSPDGKFVAAADEDGTVLLWNRISKKNIYTYHGHTSRVNALAWSPDGKYITSASQDKTVQVWNATTGDNVFVYRNHTASVNDVVWSLDGKRIASASDDRTAQVWDAVDGENVVVYRGHDAPVRSIAWSPAPGSCHIATASNDQTVQIWDSFSGNHLYTYDASGSQ